MPYKKQVAKKSKSVISENLRRFLMTGEQEKGDLEVFMLAGSQDRLEKVWDAVKDEILRDWVKEHPCQRPFIFWLLATEGRKKIGGSGDGWRPGMTIDCEGLPKYWQLGWNTKQALNFESQAMYLQRHELLNEVEERYLEQHPELLEPERVEYEEDEED